MTTTIDKDELKNEILDIRLIDVRDDFSYKFAHIQGATNIPLDHLEEEAQERYTHEEKLVLYGEDEEQGEEASKILEDAGFERVTLYKGGMKDWRQAHFPVKRVDLGHQRRE